MRFYLLVLMMLCLVGSALAVNVSIPGNTTYQFNFTNSTGGNESWNFFAVPLLVNASVNATNLSLSLDAGQIYNYQDGNVNLHATCASSNVTPEAMCTLGRILSPGENYERHSGACDLNLKCTESLPQEDEDVCLGVVEVNQTKDYGIENNDGEITFEFDGVEQTFKCGEPFDFKSQIVYSCQVPVDFHSEELGDQLSDLCSQTNPYLLGWYDTTMNAYTTLQQNCDSNKDENRESEQRLMAELASSNEAKVDCISGKNNAESKAMECEDYSDKIQGEKSMWSAYGIILTVLVVLMFVAGGTGWFLYIRERGLRGGAK